MRAPRALLATIVATAAALAPAMAFTAPAQAAEPAALVSITLNSFAPSLPQQNSTITVTGEVRNTSKKRIYRPRAYFWRNQAPITDTEGFDQALDSASNDPVGARLITAGSFQDLADADDPYLDPGAEAEFSLKVKVSDLDLSPTSGIYLMGVHVLENHSAPAIGRARVFVPVLSKTPRNTLQMTSIVALTSRPSLLRRGATGQKSIFVDDHLAREIQPGGRLDVLLRAADQDNVTFAVDPAVIEEIQAIKNGYQIDGSGKDGPGRFDAERWLQGFARLMSDRDGYRLLYGSVDIAAMTHAGRQDILQASVAASKAVTLTASLPLLVWPGGGVADAQTVTAAEDLRPAAVLMSDSSTRATAPLVVGLSEPGRLAPSPIVSYTSAAFGGGPGPEPSDTPVHLQQRLLAQSWIQATTQPAGTTLGHVRVISTAAQAEGDDESVKAPWIKQTTLTQLLHSAPVKWTEVLHYSAAAQAKELTGAQLAAMAQLSTGWATWEDLLVDRNSAQATAGAALARVASVSGRGEGKTFKAYVAPQQSYLENLLDSIQISVTRRVLTPKSQVRFPITIRNTLPASTDPADVTLNQVRVQLLFTSTNSQRLTVQPISLTTIAADDNFQGLAVVDARTNGTVRVVARLYTASGRPFGRTATIDVRATQAGTVGWFIAIGAGIVLLGTTTLRIRQVTRERARTSALEAAVPSDATRSAPAEDTSPSSTSESIDV